MLDVGVVNQRLAGLTPASDAASVSVNRQCKLVPVNMRCRSAGGKVTVGLPCVTDLSGLSVYGLQAYETERRLNE